MLAAGGQAFGMLGQSTVAPLLGIALGGVGATLGLASSITQTRMGYMQQIAGLEQSESIAGASGFGLDYGSAAGYGFGPTQAAPMLADFYRNAGSGARGANVNKMAFGGTLAGVSPGSFSSLLGMGQEGMGAAYASSTSGGGGRSAPGGGGMGNIVDFVAGQAQAGGLRGAKIEEYLGKMTGYTQQLAEKGIRTDLTDVLGVTEAMRQGGMSVRMAQQATMSLGGIAGEAREKLVSPFRGAASALMLSEAFGEGRSHKEAIRFLEKAQGSPSKVMRGLRNQGAISEFLLPYMSSEQAEGVLGVPDTIDRGGFQRFRGGQGGAMMKGFARQEQKLIGKTREDPALNAAVLALDTTVKEASLTMTQWAMDTTDAMKGPDFWQGLLTAVANFQTNPGQAGVGIYQVLQSIKAARP